MNLRKNGDLESAFVEFDRILSQNFLSGLKDNFGLPMVQVDHSSVAEPFPFQEIEETPEEPATPRNEVEEVDDQVPNAIVLDKFREHFAEI
jgi:hypothetical protein